MKKYFHTAALAGAFVAGFSGAVFAAERAQPAYNWTGSYIGGNAGYGWGDPSSFLTWNQDADDSAPLTPANYNIRLHGFLGGLQAGYNYQQGSWLVGAETDFQFSDIDGATTTPSTFLPGLNDNAHFSETQKVKWLGTLRARAGFLAEPWLLIYGTGGLAYGSVAATSLFAYETPPFATYTGATTTTRVGWTAGAGVEIPLSGRWSIKTEYLHYDLGKVSVSGHQPGNSTFVSLLSQRASGDIVRAGLNYKFGAP